MIEAHQRFSPNWWDYSFCIEVDWGGTNFLCLRRSGWYFEKRFDRDSFELALERFREEFQFNDRMGMVHYIQKHGNLRLRPGPVWNQPYYQGDIFDFPVVWDPFTKFPFGPI